MNKKNKLEILEKELFETVVKEIRFNNDQKILTASSNLTLKKIEEEKIKKTLVALKKELKLKENENVSIYSTIHTIIFNSTTIAKTVGDIRSLVYGYFTGLFSLKFLNCKKIILSATNDITLTQIIHSQWSDMDKNMVASITKEIETKFNELINKKND